MLPLYAAPLLIPSVPVGAVLNRGRGDEGYYRYYQGPAARSADEILPPATQGQEKT